MVPHYKPDFGNDDIAAAAEIIRSGQLAQGEKVAELEQRFADYTGRQYAIAVSSGTTALFLSLKALKIGKNDEVIIPSYTCSALWHAVCATNAVPVYAEIESGTFNLDPLDVKKKLTRKTKAVIFPHMFGQPGFIEEVKTLGIPVIEDIAQAVGATIRNCPTGSFGDIVISSFYATKPVGAGEGGIILTDNTSIADQIRDLREYDERQNLTLRYNAKMTEITAAIAIQQFAKLPASVSRRKAIISMYQTIIEKHCSIPCKPKNGTESNYYRCIITVPDREANAVIKIAESMGVCFRRPVFKPLHLHHPHEKMEITESAWRKQVSIPVFVNMNKKEINLVISVLKHIFNRNV